MQHRRVFAVAVLSLAFLTGDARGQGTVAAPPAGADSRPRSVGRIENFGTLASFVNLASGTVRLIVITSPSSPNCTSILETVAETLRKNGSRRLRAYVVMTRLGDLDTEIWAINQMTTLDDRRVVYLWDPKAVAAGTFRPAVNSTTEPATDVCFLYDTDARLTPVPPRPEVWMSANPRLDGKPFDAKELGARADELVRRVEAKASEAARSSR